MNSALTDLRLHVEQTTSVPWRGRVVQASAALVESEGPLASSGESCWYETRSEGLIEGEVVGFRGARVLSVPLAPGSGIGYGDRVVVRGEPGSIAVGEALLGRVVDAGGKPLDGGRPLRTVLRWPLDRGAPLPLTRAAIREPLQTGVRAIDACLTCGRGQRVGIFGGSGVGKSTLVGMMTRNTSADLTVLALVGERGREVREFLEGALGEEGRRRAVVVVSTSDQGPLLRLRAAMAATSIAEYFAASGKQVLLVVDSITRFAMAQREIGLAAGEPPTARGYTPSVFSKLARLLERAGNFGDSRGSITGFYSVLMEGDDQQDPVVDAVRAILDGHIVLDRELAVEGHYPPIQIVDSLSRLMAAVASEEHQEAARRTRHWLALYRKSEDLIRVGAYVKGSDPELDRAVAMRGRLREFLTQRPDESAALAGSIAALEQLAQ